MKRFRAYWVSVARSLSPRRCKECQREIPAGARFCSAECEDHYVTTTAW